MANNVDKMLSDVGYNTQTKIGEEELPKASGFIRNLTITPREGKDQLYKFQLRYLDKDDNIVEPNTWYSGFKMAPGKDGDYLLFTYKINGIYNNIKDILDIKMTHEEITVDDEVELKQAKLNIEEPRLETNLSGDNVSITNNLAPEGLTEPYRALLLNATIQLCTRRGTMSDEDIKAQYNRFLKII